MVLPPVGRRRYDHSLLSACTSINPRPDSASGPTSVSTGGLGSESDTSITIWPGRRRRARTIGSALPATSPGAGAGRAVVTATEFKLMQGFARVQSGDLSDGLRHAQAAYETLPSDQRTTMVTGLARSIVDAVPFDARGRSDVT